MVTWHSSLKYDPRPPLLASGSQAVQFFARRDLLDEDVGPVQQLWQLPEALRCFRKQQADGSWPRAGEQKHAAINVALIETWRQFRFLVEQFGFTREHPDTRRAAEFIFSCQTEAGDFRGFLANQYATYYTGALLALLIQAGYAEDARVEKGLEWLLSMRQDDGGWTIPILTHPLDRATQYRLTSEFVEALDPNRSKPFSHHCTGMILRAFAVHPAYRYHEAAVAAADLLKSRFFQPDAYTSYHAASYWVRFEYPFWWNNLLTALDSLTRMGMGVEDPQIKLAAGWLVDHQEESGLWKISYAKPGEAEKETVKVHEMKRWVSLAICRVLKRLYT